MTTECETGEPRDADHAAADDTDRTARRRACVPARGWVPRRVARRVAAAGRDAGMATAEYAIATLAAVGFAGLLVVILKGNEVRGLLLGIVKQALSL
ncbi:DUF4244 domain-containing protein [Cellulomonas sp.]|uniref:DUF4244 domain-containing protein n=1 Tax=Cellulomonas sp. TaxID=40001 RepID=UPI00258A14D9|nr:DUF4244 domain-containing protein [Cellulomonas sp.]MCR6689120.1 DUF4244 domain-containing protein [Cellulomonas sp.]